MNSVSSRPSRRNVSLSFFLLVPCIALAAALMTGCGGGTSGSTLSGNTTAVVMASSTANGQLTGFEGTIESLTLTNKAGKQVTLIASPVSEEFIHLNGTVEPLATLSIPQDTYVSAAASVGSMYPLCSGQAPGETYSDQFANTGVTVNLPAPITVTGSAMGLVLNLDVSRSTPFSGTCPTPAAFNTVPQGTSVFNLTSMTIAAEPTNGANGKTFGLRGIISSVAAGGSSLTINSLSGRGGLESPSWTATVNNATTLQGGLSAAQLVAGAAVDMDAVIQQDGSLLATRIALIEIDLPSLTIAGGPLLNVTASEPVILFDGTAQEGLLSPYMNGSTYYSFGNATFQTSSQIENLTTLPFTASFNAANMVAGQRVLVSTQATAMQGGPNYVPLTQVLLLPQTINGTISSISNQSAFTTYTVQLAAYDLFPTFAVQPGQTTLLTTPNTITVYADSNTQMLNSSAVSVGSVLRFNGPVFNDNGTLRMDCTQVNDGVTE
jgi:hypothetical protein